MKEVLRKARRYLAPSEELYRKLSRSQRKVLLAVVGGGLLALVWLAGRGGGAPSTGSWRESANVPSTGTGTSATSEAGSREAPDPGGRTARGLFEIYDPEEAEERTWQEQLRKIEDLISVGDVVDAKIVSARHRRSARVLGRSPSVSATVQLFLRDGVDSLDRKVAESKRIILASALGSTPECVEMLDNHANYYPHRSSDGSPWGLDDGADGYRERVESIIRTFYSGPFQDEELRVSVLVGVSQEELEIAEEEYGADRIPTKRVEEIEKSATPRFPSSDGGIGGAVDLRIVPDRGVSRLRTEEEYQLSRSKTFRKVPRGALEQVSVGVSMDLAAVKEQIERSFPRVAASGFDALAQPEADALLADFREAREAELAKLLKPLREVEVQVSLAPFDSAASSEIPAALLAQVAEAAPAAEASVDPWLMAALASGGVLGVGGLLWGTRRWRRRRRALGSLRGLADDRRASPSLDSHGESGWGLDRILGRRVPLEDGEAGERPHDSLMRQVRWASERVRRRPEVATAVVRFWLGQEAEGQVSGAGRR